MVEYKYLNILVTLSPSTKRPYSRRKVPTLPLRQRLNFVFFFQLFPKMISVEPPPHLSRYLVCKTHEILKNSNFVKNGKTVICWNSPKKQKKKKNQRKWDFLDLG